MIRGSNFGPTGRTEVHTEVSATYGTDGTGRTATGCLIQTLSNFNKAVVCEYIAGVGGNLKWKITTVTTTTTTTTT